MTAGSASEEELRLSGRTHIWQAEGLSFNPQHLSVKGTNIVLESKESQSM